MSRVATLVFCVCFFELGPIENKVVVFYIKPPLHHLILWPMLAL